MLAGFLLAIKKRSVPIGLSCCTPHNLGVLQRRFPEIEWVPFTYENRVEKIQSCDVWLGLGDSPFQSVVGTTCLITLLKI
jgi:hypothetical protein